MGRSYSFGWFLLAICLGYVSSADSCTAQEREALLDFIKPFDQELLYRCDYFWNSSLDCCEWKGIYCGLRSRRHVHSVYLLCLRGPLLSNGSIFRLRYLEYLRLSGDFENPQKASLPDDIGSKLGHLRELRIENFNMSGSIPICVCSIKNLRILELNGCNLTGTLPTCLFEHPNLLEIDFEMNRLEGSLPQSVTNQTRLERLSLATNMINGSVPTWVFTLPSLRFLSLANNNLTGSIKSFEPPATTALQTMRLGNNSISGSVPRSLFQLVNLTELTFSDNLLSGDIEWHWLQAMRNLYLQFDGNRGLSFSNSNGSILRVPMLSIVNIASTNTSEFPTSLSGVDSLYTLIVSNTNIGGRIFTRGSGRWRLGTFSASHTHIEGFDDIPDGIFEFDLSFNKRMSGEIPTVICNATSPYDINIDLSFNNLTGVIPPCMMNISSLAYLNLQGNHLHGTIPDVSLPCRLHLLRLSDNNFEGALPRSLRECTSLFTLDVGNNNITDIFPGWLDYVSLYVLILRRNNFYGNISISTMGLPFGALQILDLSFNSFVGSIGIIANFSRIYVPPFFTSIDLSSNGFSGPIAGTFGELTLLKVLNLSKNMLVGQIPQELMNMNFLELLNVSYNKLEGPIPTGKRAELFSSSSYLGNPGLCGFPLSKVC